MHLNDPWKELYKNWPARNDREAQALKLLSEAKSERIIEETGKYISRQKDLLDVVSPEERIIVDVFLNFHN